jgi:hypothetical protein
MMRCRAARLPTEPTRGVLPPPSGPSDGGDGEMFMRQQMGAVSMEVHRLENLAATSQFSNGSRLFINAVGDEPRSSIPKPTNRRNSRF